MRKVRNLISMPVIYRRKKIGRLIQVQLSPDLKQMEGVWVDGGLRGTLYIPSEQLSMIGKMAVMADARGTRRKLHNIQPLYRAVSTDGRRLGAIVGAEVDEISFLVCRLELMRGIWDDYYFGRFPVVHYSVNPEKSEVIVLDPANDEEREDDPQ